MAPRAVAEPARTGHEPACALPNARLQDVG